MSYTSIYIPFDLETGGLDSEKNAITEICMIAVDGETLEEIDKFNRLIKPYDAIYTKEAEDVSGISFEMLEEIGEDVDKVFDDLADWLTSHKVKGRKPVLVGHNIEKFDIPMLETFFKRSKSHLSKFVSCRKSSGEKDCIHSDIVEKQDKASASVLKSLAKQLDEDTYTKDDLLELVKDALSASVDKGLKSVRPKKEDVVHYNCLDTLDMARDKFVDLAKFTLTECCTKAGITIEEAHRAEPDTVGTMKLFVKMMRDLRRDGGVAQTQKKKRRLNLFM